MIERASKWAAVIWQRMIVLFAAEFAFVVLALTVFDLWSIADAWTLAKADVIFAAIPMAMMLGQWCVIDDERKKPANL